MRTRTRGAAIVIDLIQTTEEIGEIVKLATKLNYESHVENAADKNVPGFQVRLTRDPEWTYWGEDDLVNWTVLLAYVKGLSGDAVLALVRGGLEARHFSMEKPLQDVMSIGAGEGHQGHDDD